MFFGCWNIRGLNDPMKQAEVRRFFRDEKLSFCGLIETKVKECNVLAISRAINPSWKLFCHPGFLPFGRIWVMWNPCDVNVVIIRYSSQAIHCQVTHVSSSWSCLVTVVYGECCFEKRKELWADLVSCGYDNEGYPWTVLGDFNAIMTPFESCGGSSDWLTWKDVLRTCFAQSGLDDV